MNEYGEYFIYGSSKYDKAHPKSPKNIVGCINSGISEHTARLIWDKMVKFASYAFNKSHATCYAGLGARTAWLACHYPVEYMTGVLNSYIGTNDKIVKYTSVCKNLGINLLGPNINKSVKEFQISEDNNEKSIVFGLCGIKGVGDAASDAVIKNRQDEGEYTSFENFLMRNIDTIDKSTLEALIYTGAMDCFEGNRNAKIGAMPDIMKVIKKLRGARRQMNLFDALGSSATEMIDIPIDMNTPDFSNLQKSLLEKDYLGFFIKHPISEFSDILNKWRRRDMLHDIGAVCEAAPENGKIQVRIAGIVSDKDVIYYRDSKGKQKPLLKFTLGDESGSIKCVCFKDDAVKYGSIILNNSMVYLLAEVSKDDFGPQGKITELYLLDDSKRNKVE